jgi:hypothetical protein
MKINLKKSVAQALVAAGLLVPGSVYAEDLNTNLIVDPGFEDVDDANPGAYGALPLNSWRDGTDIGFTYASGQYDNGGPLAGGGERYFTSNQTGSGSGQTNLPGEVAQTVFGLGAGDTGAAITAGLAEFTLSAFFSTYSADQDFGQIQVEFFDAADTSLGTAQLDAPAGLQTWTEFSVFGAVPVGTDSALVSVYGTPDPTGGGADGYIDNVNFSISAIPEPATGMIMLVGLFGTMAVRRRRDG